MKKKQYLVLKIILTSLCIFFVACSSSDNNPTTEEKELYKKLVIGTSPSTTKLLEAAFESLAQQGYQIEVKPFDDYVLPNIALQEGTIAANLYQHEPYLNAYNETAGQKLVMTGKVATSLVGFYSNKYVSIETLPYNAKIAIFQDVSNQDRSLRMMEELGLLTLEKKNGLYSLLDIKDNKKGFKFVTMDINQLTKGIMELDAGFAAAIAIHLSGHNPRHTFAIEDMNEHAQVYAIGLVVREKDVQEEWVEIVLKAFKTKETKDNLFASLKDSYRLIY